MIQQNLIIYTERLSDEALLRLQRSSGVHLCPSREEGFGHYINEARAMGALVMTTNWAPMNDMVQEHFGVLIPCRLTSTSLYRSSLPGNQACRVGRNGIEAAMRKYFNLIKAGQQQHLDTEEAPHSPLVSNDGSDVVKDDADVEVDSISLERVAAMGEFARERYEDDRDDFRDRVHNLFGKLLPQMMLTHQDVHNDETDAAADAHVEQQ
jgi:hypothetical protein